MEKYKTFLIIFLILILFLWKNKMCSRKEILSNSRQEKKFVLNSDHKVLISRFSLTDSIEPKDTYDKIKCRKSELINIKTTLCIHDLDKDRFVSKSIWLNGVWERDILEHFLKLIRPEHLIFDIGAHIGF